MSNVPARAPERPPEWNPNAERYWDPADFEQEVRRTFQICHDCRMCVTYCGSFPLLFEALDRDVDEKRSEGAENVTPETIERVSDHCWQCKLCYIKCPYTADEGSYELLDFPRLMAREKALRARQKGIPLVDRVLGEPELIGKLGAGIQAPIVNLINESRLLRKVAEAVTGISAEFPLPPLASTPFSRWYRRRPRALAGAGQDSVVLFPTCYGEYNFPEVPEALVRVLEHNGIAVVLPEGLACCGMPNLDGGNVAAAKRKMQKSVDALLEHVRAGRRVVVPGPTCGYTIKKEWPEYLGTPEAKEVAAASFDAMEFLDRLRREKKLKKDFKSGPRRIAYHTACHLRAQKVGYPGARVLELLPEADVRVVERCTAVDGTWGMKAAYYAEGARYAGKLREEVSEEAAEHADLSVVTDCSLAGLRILEQTGKRPQHPIELLATAYGLPEASS